MKRKLALMLTMTLLAGSLDSGMLVSAADFSAEESVEQAVEEEPQPTEENGAEELTDAEEELPSDEAAASETEQVDDPGEDGSEMTESGVNEADISTELETEPETDPELEEEPESLAEDPGSAEVEEAQLEDGSEDTLSGGADNAGFEWNGLRCISNEKGEVTIKAVINDDHYDKNNKDRWRKYPQLITDIQCHQFHQSTGIHQSTYGETIFPRLTHQTGGHSTSTKFSDNRYSNQ